MKLINEKGGIAGRPIEIVAEDDGTDPKRGAEVVEKFATQHKVDVAFGTLFSHVVMGSAPRAGELKLPYYVVSEGYHVASGALNRYTFQPGITDVRAQVTSMAPWVSANLGKKVTMIFPDYAFGHDHRDFFSAAIQEQGGAISDADPDPADGKLLHPLFPADPGRYRGALPRDGRAGGADLREGARRAFRLEPAADLRLHRFARGGAAVEPRPGVPGGHLFLGGLSPLCRREHQTRADKFYREKVGVDANGASTSDPNDISTYSHMFGCWETLYVIKQAIEASGYKSATDADKKALVEATEAITTIPEGNEHPQGDKLFNGKIHQVFGHQNISKVEGGKLNVVHRTADRGRDLRAGGGLHGNAALDCLGSLSAVSRALEARAGRPGSANADAGSPLPSGERPGEGKPASIGAVPSPCPLPGGERRRQSCGG